MAPTEVVKIVDILLEYLPPEEVERLLEDFKPVTPDKEYQAVLVRLLDELASREEA
jgi:hypothetical protein